MINIEQVKDEYRKEVTKLLSGFPEVFQAFEKAWQSEQYRQAHLVVHEATTQLDLKYSDQQDKAFRDFYCLFVA